ncbi:YhgE/Pip domain-containing protein [Fictibacillus sp. KIGAM418]|uniref:YhgE/Pip domain-containing protein n=1 Tax=Fictibacillus marinisediminis TaxID=2878389 RepID=A0A9X1XAF1_9BACL|nr:YhgE/Pip domain-containing protein [Fictibacillus marinisediminis]MCK6255773.1 YhgE/Pip domain-containing protein [Fictibacillus marinisediminis]
MKVFSLFKAEMAGLAAKKGLLISVIITLLVPVVYGGILLSPRWGPYDNLSNLPVAVVNNDQGADTDGETINAGKDLVADLEKGKDLGWKFVDSDEAKSGLKSLKYYMVIEIPKDFSKKVTTVLSTDPQKPELKYVQNEGLNFMAAQVTKSATAQIREKLADRITEKYVNNMFVSLKDVTDGIQTAADGSSKLNGGTSDLQKGTGTLLESLTNKSGDISRLAAGAKELKKGTGQMYQSLSEKQNDITKLANGSAQVNNGLGQMLQSLTSKQGDIKKLADGSSALEKGTGQVLGSLTANQGNVKRLASGSEDLKNGTNTLLASLKAGSGDIAKLAAGSEAANEGTGLLLNSLKDKQEGVAELAAGAKVLNDKMPALKEGTAGVLYGLKNMQNKLSTELQPGTQQVAGGVAKVAENAQALGAGLQGLSSALNSYLEAHPDLKNDPNFMKIVGTGQVLSQKANDPENAKQLGALKDGSANIASAFGKDGAMTAGLEKLVAGQTLIDNGVGELNEKAPQLKAGTEQVATGWNTMVTKVGDLHAGTAQIAAGNQTVNKGWSSMTDGVTKLDNGAGLLSAGNASFNKGWNDLKDATAQIHDGQVQVRDGNADVNKGWHQLTDGTTKLYAGSGQVSGGNADVNKGWKDLTAGANKIHSGTMQVSDGNATVEKGWGDLTSGVTKLNNGAKKLNDGSGELASGLKDGAAKTSSLKTPDSKNFNMFASPVKLKSDKVFKFPHYRDSTAPYVLTLALFAGILIMSMFMNFKRTEEVSAAAWFGAKFMNLSVLAIAQALLLSIVVMILAVNVENPAGFVLFAIFVSIVFSAIVTFFAALGIIGRFLGLAFVVLQLSITGANLPIDMLPANMRALSEFLPFTYSIAGFKSVLSLDAPGTALFNASVLFIYLVAFALLAFAVIFVSRGRHTSQEDTAGFRV